MDLILLVEDNPDDVALTMRALRRHGIANEIMHVPDGVAALDFLRAQGPYEHRRGHSLPTLMLLDLNLPRLNGLEVLRRIRADPTLHRLPVVILTSSKEETDVATGYDLGVNSYVRKPVDFLEFVEAVQSLGTYWMLVNERPPAT